MFPATSFAGKTVALFGLGSSGEVTALALQAGGANVWAWDDNAASRDHAAEKGIMVVDLNFVNWEQVAALILSPGVPLTHPEPHWSARLAQAAGVEIIGDVELFFRERAKLVPNAPCVCITGTNGKSTTTALIAHMLTSLGQNVQMGGNIGVPVLALEAPADNRIHVLEISTFQSDLAPSIAPTVGVLLNLAEDHLDRHGTMARYASLKQHVVEKAAVAVIGQDDAHTKAIGETLFNTGQKIITISGMKAMQNGFSVEGTDVVYAEERIVQARFNLAGIDSLRGRHNAQNAAAALAACYALGFTNVEALQKALYTFPGLPHRMEFVGRLGKAVFVNDSKATNADATQWALLAFDDIYWIVGGKDKSDGIDPLVPLFSRIKKAYLVGASAVRFAQTLEGTVPYILAGTVENAIDLAAQDAIEDAEAFEPVVLLSPACASYDQFKSFEQRGDVFRSHVQNLLRGHDA